MTRKIASSSLLVLTLVVVQVASFNAPPSRPLQFRTLPAVSGQTSQQLNHLFGSYAPGAKNAVRLHATTLNPSPLNRVKNTLKDTSKRFLRFICSIFHWFKGLFGKSKAVSQEPVIYTYSSTSKTNSNSSPSAPAAASDATIKPSTIIADERLAQARKYAEERIRALSQASSTSTSPSSSTSTSTASRHSDAADAASLQYPGVTSKGLAGVEEPGRWPPRVSAPLPKPLSPRRSLSSLTDADLRGKRVLYRCDLTASSSSPSSMDALLPSLSFLVARGAKVLVASHLHLPGVGEQGGRRARGQGYEAAFSLEPLAAKLREKVRDVGGSDVVFVPDCVGLAVAAAVAGMKEGGVALLENVDFYAEEGGRGEGGAYGEDYAKMLAKQADIFVLDSVEGAMGGGRASVEGVARLITPAVMGLHLEHKLAEDNARLWGGMVPLDVA